MVKIKVLKPVRKGYIRLRDLVGIPTESARQIKIGSEAYYIYLNSRVRDSAKKTKKEKRKILSHVRNRKMTDLGFDYVRSLIRRRHKFSNREKAKVYKILRDLNTRGKYVLNFRNIGQEAFNTRSYTLNKPEKLRNLVNILSNGYFEENTMGVGSDLLENVIQRGIADVQLLPVRRKKIVGNKGVNFFRYFNKTDIDLTDCQILRETDNMDILKSSCLIYALEKYGIDNTLLSRVKNTFQKGSYFPRNRFPEVSNIIQKNIILSWYDAKKSIRSHKIINEDFKDTIELGMYEDHIFLNSQTDYTSFSIVNYNEVKHISNFNNFTERSGKYYKSKNPKKINYLKLVHLLFIGGHFEKDPMILTYKNQYQKFTDKKEYLDNLEEEQQLCEDKINDEEEEQQLCEVKKKNKCIFYADVESDVSSQDNHIPLLIGVVKDRKNISINDCITFTNDDSLCKVVKDFLNYVHSQSSKDDHIIIYFHNLKYDYTVLQPYLFLREAPLERDGQYYRINILHKGRTYELRDSYKLANFPLSKFNETFQLDKDMDKKEAIPYNYFRISNINDEKVNVAEFENMFKYELSNIGKNEKIKKQIKIFRNNLKSKDRWMFDIVKEDGVKYFNAGEYYRYYLKYDCLVLAKGLRKFRNILLDFTDNDLDLHNSLTISSLSNKYFKNSGCFEDLYEVKGNLRNFLSKAITGGRVQVNKKYKKKVIEGKLADYDACSLYPSSIYRLCREMGLPKGMCKRLNTTDFKTIKNYSYSVMKVKINKINKYQQLPMVSYKNKEGLLQYVNNLDEPIISYIDIITLEDWINFQGIEYEIIDGVYWNEGYNNKMGDVIKTLYDERVKHKKAGNQALQKILKLMMNSAYGKTIMRKSMNSKVLVYDKNKESYIDNNFYLINDVSYLKNGQCIVNKDDTDNSFNLSHVGILILSYSKRIMNEVFDTANNHNCPLYYTDTDSIHCNYDDVKIIEREFKKKYNKDLTGKYMEQFHIDFEIENEKCKDIYATKSIFLGKKCYIDCLEGVRKKDNKIVNDVHFRIKGVNGAGMKHYADNYCNGDIFKVYENLAQSTKDNKMRFYLNPAGYGFSFEYNNNVIETRESNTFYRDIYF